MVDGAPTPDGAELVDGSGPLLIVCEHASHTVPAELGDLGLDETAQCSHIGWDIGAAAVARGVARRLDASLVLAPWSRLVVDLNRPLGAPDLIPEASGGVIVPGNRALDAAERRRRIASYFDPFHAAVADAAERCPVPTALLALHSFTPKDPRTGAPRPWHCGVAHDGDPFGRALLRALRREPGVHVGDNDPYGISRDEDYTVWVHGRDQGRPATLVELRQDLIVGPGEDAWTDLLYRALAQALRDIGMH